MHSQDAIQHELCTSHVACLKRVSAMTAENSHLNVGHIGLGHIDQPSVFSRAVQSHETFMGVLYSFMRICETFREHVDP